ncbi:hypothetical protein KFL_003740080 [Klebsormidium nitens]|uniref:Uncharacterized protein n=1 Tax=Klebsormidium nitens TaxID=105231 RepID=A0A1Y1IG94_KLENI|nr:hypothetical protein KFL_003740080 [Klebsormidium nitens]|eukprot:GAQ87747.1 hypothetical protein KFL_003740080 [Klebsormidium nitens]
MRCSAKSREPTARPRLEPPPGLVRWEGALFLTYFMTSLGESLSKDRGLLLREHASFQLLKTLVSEQRRLLAETEDLVTWVQELGWLAEVVKERGGVFEEAVNVGLRDAVTPLGRRAISAPNYREMVESYLAVWDEHTLLAEIQVLPEVPMGPGLSQLLNDKEKGIMIPADVSRLFLTDDFLTLRRVTHSLAFVSLSASILKSIKETVEGIEKAASNPQECHESVLTLLRDIEAMGGPLAARLRYNLPGDLHKNDDGACFLFTENEYGENMVAAAHDLKCTVDMMLECVAKVDEPIGNSRDATEWDVLAATGAFSGVQITAAPPTLEETIEQNEVVFIPKGPIPYRDKQDKPPWADFRPEAHLKVPVLLASDRGWSEEHDLKGETPWGEEPTLVPQACGLGSIDTDFGVAFVSIPNESKLKKDSDAMHITEFWRLRKRQFLELYSAWSAGMDDPGAMFCPGFALLRLFFVQLFLFRPSGIRSGGPGVIVGWPSEGSLGLGAWFSDKESVQRLSHNLKVILRDIFQFAPTAKPVNLVAHGLGASYVTSTLATSYREFETRYLGTLIVAASAESAGSLEMWLRRFNEKRGKNGEPPVECVRYVQTNNRPFAFEKLLEFSDRAKDGESLEVCCGDYVTISCGSGYGDVTNQNLLCRNRRVLAESEQTLRKSGEQWKKRKVVEGYENLYELEE